MFEFRSNRIIFHAFNEEAMKKKFSAVSNHEMTRKAIGYVTRGKATSKDYERIGFMSGLVWYTKTYACPGHV